eukprot:6265309-Amphidinium_carterae.1
MCLSVQSPGCNCVQPTAKLIHYGKKRGRCDMICTKPIKIEIAVCNLVATLSQFPAVSSNPRPNPVLVVGKGKASMV